MARPNTFSIRGFDPPILSADLITDLIIDLILEEVFESGGVR